MPLEAEFVVAGERHAGQQLLRVLVELLEYGLGRSADKGRQIVARIALPTAAAPSRLIARDDVDRLAADLAEFGRELAQGDRRADEMIDLARVPLAEQHRGAGSGDIVARDVVAAQIRRVGGDPAFADIAFRLAAETLGEDSRAQDHPIEPAGAERILGLEIIIAA